LTIYGAALVLEEFGLNHAGFGGCVEGYFRSLVGARDGASTFGAVACPLGLTLTVADEQPAEELINAETGRLNA
jgi:hypothetical protein